jgi:hypothetical protein
MQEPGDISSGVKIPSDFVRMYLVTYGHEQYEKYNDQDKKKQDKENYSYSFQYCE